MKYSNCIFDIDGTIINTEETCCRSLMITVKELLGKEMSYDEAKHYFGLPSNTVSGEVGFSDTALFASVWEQHFRELFHLIRPFEGSIGMVKKIHDSGITTGIVTSRSRVEIAYDPNIAEFLPYIDVLLSADDSPRPKPFPDPMFVYMEKASEIRGEKVEPGDCIFFGDAKYDFMCAEGAGVDFGQADWYNNGNAGFEKAVMSYNSAEEVIKFLGI